MGHKKETFQEMRLQGAPVSEGIAIGTAYFLTSKQEEIPEFPIKLSEVDAEIARYRQALFSSREDLTRLRGDLAKEGSSEAISFIDTHIQMLDDPMITVQMEENIRHMLKNTESVFRSVISDYEERFSVRSNSFFEERLVDVRDVSNRILGHLLDAPLEHLGDIAAGSIIFAKELSPSHTAAAHPDRITAFVTLTGGGNSHAALIARSKGIPFISGIEIAEIAMFAQAPVIVDGTSGELILHPTEETLRTYQKRQNQMKERTIRYSTMGALPAETLDGFSVRLLANVGSPSDFDIFPDSCEGIGLFRTEYLLLPGQRGFPSEDEQIEAYRSLIEKCVGRSIVMRVFDLGGDKSPGLKSSDEPNPVLGCRGIRFLLKNRNLFAQQLRAIFRAARGADVRLLLPLITDVTELHTAKKIIEEVRKEIGSAALPIGCMIEVPSAVITCDVLARNADFLSIGTNDLVQYTLGVDRSNPAMSDLLYPAHPSILRMLKMVANVASRQGKPVTICGEIASNPHFTRLLLGLGLKEFSCAPRYLPQIKEAIRETTILEAYALAERALTLEDPKDIAKLLQSF